MARPTSVLSWYVLVMLPAAGLDVLGPRCAWKNAANRPTLDNGDQRLHRVERVGRAGEREASESNSKEFHCRGGRWRRIERVKV